MPMAEVQITRRLVPVTFTREEVESWPKLTLAEAWREITLARERYLFERVLEMQEAEDRQRRRVCGRCAWVL